MRRKADFDIDVGKGAELCKSGKTAYHNISYNDTTQPCMQEHRNSNAVRTRRNASKQSVISVKIDRHLS